MTRARLSALLCALLGGCNFAPVDGKTLYRCQADRSCVLSGYFCASDGLCHPPGDDAGGGGGAGGGGSGGSGGGGGGGGNACVPTHSCQARSCGKLDDGCGMMLVCGACPGADFCGGGGPNLCGQQICTGNGWCWENPYPQGNFLRGAWAASADDVWAVGDVGTVLRFNGKHWLNVDSPTRANLRGVFGTSPSSVWLVGDTGTVLHWDGVSLTAEAAGTSNDLNAVWSTPDGVVWVAGVSSTLSMRNSAGVWSLFQPASLNVNFRGIWGFDPLDVWVVGDREIEHLNGVKFVQVPVTLPGGSTLNTLWGPGPNALIATGSSGLLASFAGGVWSTQQLGQSPNGRAVFGTSSDDFWLLSDRGVARSVGGVVQQVLPGPPSPYVAGASLDGGEVLVVGNNGEWAVVAGDGGVTTNYAGSISDLNDVFALSPATVVAVGGPNSWFERFPNGGVPSWRRFGCSTGFSQTMLSVWVAPTGYAYATATSNDTVGFKLGTGQCNPGFDSVTYTGVFGFANGPVHYVGDRYTEYIPDGGQPPQTVDLSNPDQGTDATVWSSVWGSSASEMFSVGTDGGLITLLDYDAGWAWAPSASVNADLSSIYGVGAGSTLDVWAVGAQGTVLRRQGASPFAVVDAGLTDDLRDVWVGSPTEVWTVGRDGGAWKFDGARWTAVRAPVRDLRRIHGAADAGVWAVGSAGTILFHP